MAAACRADRWRRSQPSAICVHGDYDADGICATALAVLVLRNLGANVGWHLPSRFEEGYGVGAQAPSSGSPLGRAAAGDGRLRHHGGRRGARARELGMDVIVTDHHQSRRPELPDCSAVCTRPSDYPFPELCGTGVVLTSWRKRSARGWAATGTELDEHLDLVALATVADVVPLVDENRGLVRAGLRRHGAHRARPGLRALMAAARVDRATCRRQ